MRKLILMVPMLISSCATTVHINNQYLDQDECNRLSSELRKAGYRVKIRKNAFPAEITVNTIIYYPSSKSSAELLELQDILEADGYSVSDIAVGTKGNHHYTKSNIGIYPISSVGLVDSAVKLFDPSIVDVEFVSEACGGVTVLNILPEGHYIMENLSEPKAFQKVTGAWRISEFSDIQFTYQDKVYAYIINKSRADHVGYIEHDITLTPTNTDALPLGCVYQYSVKEFRY